MPEGSVYRKQRDASGWHFCMNCRYWPTKDFDEISSSPTAPARLCAECVAIEQNGNCNFSDEWVP